MSTPSLIYLFISPSMFACRAFVYKLDHSFIYLFMHAPRGFATPPYAFLHLFIYFLPEHPLHQPRTRHPVVNLFISTRSVEHQLHQPVMQSLIYLFFSFMHPLAQSGSHPSMINLFIFLVHALAIHSVDESCIR